MNKISFAVPLAACLLFMGMPLQNSFAADKTDGREKTVQSSKAKKTLVAYFSHSGNTREIAKQIQKLTGGDIFEIQTVKPYPAQYNAVVDQAKDELASGYRPELKTRLKDIKQYDTVFIGYPNWWGTVPAPVRVFLTDNDLSGKTIMPFCTHEGSAMGHSESDIRTFCPKATIAEGLAIRGSRVKTAQSNVSDWLKRNNR